jgi:hypothetical protein
MNQRPMAALAVIDTERVSMSQRKEEKIVTVEKRSGSDAEASVTKDGHTSKGTGKTASDALSDAGDNAKR